MTGDEYKRMTDEELLKEVHDLAGRVSYYNAAEGNWSQETEARNAVKAEFWACMVEVKVRGLEFVDRGYLI